MDKGLPPVRDLLRLAKLDLRVDAEGETELGDVLNDIAELHADLATFDRNAEPFNKALEAARDLQEVLPELIAQTVASAERPPLLIAVDGNEDATQERLSRQVIPACIAVGGFGFGVSTGQPAHVGQTMARRLASSCSPALCLFQSLDWPALADTEGCSRQIYLYRPKADWILGRDASSCRASATQGASEMVQPHGTHLA